MNETEKAIYGTTFATVLREMKKQSLVTGVQWEELLHQHAARAAHDAVQVFRAAFETLIYEEGEEEPVTQSYMAAAEIYAVDGEVPNEVA